MSTANDLSVVVEGRADALVLGRVIGRALSLKPRFYAGGGSLALASLARNILVHDGGPVLVVMDADTTDGGTAAEGCAMTQAALRQVSGDGAFDVFAFVPQLEVAFFESPDVLRRHLASTPGPNELERGKYDPARMLKTLLARDGRSVESFYRQLDEQDVDALLGGRQMAQLTRVADELFSSHLGVHSS